MDDENTIKVLVVEPMKKPYVKEIGESLESMQEVVGGYIEEVMPFDDEVALVCNEEGKLNGLPLNRAIYDSDNKMIDIIVGTFFVCNAPFESEKFLSLTDEQEKKFSEKFSSPEIFFHTTDEIKAVKSNTKTKDYER